MRCHEVETRSSQCGLKGQFAVCKTVGGKRGCWEGLLRQASLPYPTPSTKEGSSPAGAEQSSRGPARQLAVRAVRYSLSRACAIPAEPSVLC